MKNILIEQILENYNSYKNDILSALEEYNYRKKRYGVDFTVTLYISSKEIPVEIVKEDIRETDRLVGLEKNFIAVVFDFTDEEGGLKASENLLAMLEPKLCCSQIYIGVTNSFDSIDDDEQVRRALDILVESIQSGFNNVPRISSD